MEDRLPEGADAALRLLGLRLTGSIGAGGGDPRWGAQDAQGRRAVVTVLTPRSAAHAEHLLDRVRRLAALEHPGLARVRTAVLLTGGSIAVVQEEVDGTDLLTLRAGRAAWEPGEVVTVLAPLAGALAALHGAGLCHGDVSAGNVVLTPDGAAVLVDLICGDDPHERGTPGVAAPEREDGARAPADVYALAQMGLQLLRGAGPLDGATGRADALRRCLTAAAAADPADRPEAAALLREMVRACPPRTVAVPDPAVLARAALRRGAGGPDTSRTRKVVLPQRGRHRRAPARWWASAPAVAVVALVALGGVALVGGVAALAGVGPAGVVGLLDRDADGRARPPANQDGSGGAGSSAQVVTTHDAAVAAAVRLTHQRARALAQRSLPRLMAVTVPGSPAAHTDLATLAALHERGFGVTRARVEVVEAVRVRAGRTAPEGSAPARVLVRAHARGYTDGATGGLPNAATAEERAPAVVLVMAQTPDGWRVTDVEQPPTRTG